ncbi:Atu4866 domain-containing protein [Fertoebacter nigrum]|uniref:Atu4866 domain-containing protein n=1 Tax=Fertoeibacter niger TaxID=2656921 RepID=A0A8X8H0Q9_9RHOB|nr:Atu4866 domain-containing protein [Fertoeibacter niger]NUB44996.1 Atu4866 domain-containing protein [Fertoeibacter niger]
MFTIFATIIATAAGAHGATAACGLPGPQQAAEQRAEICVKPIPPTLVNQTEDTMQSQHAENATEPHPYVGMWVTGDGRIRQELLPNGRYDEARGRRASAYVGRYEITGTSIFYWDDSGFTADGEFVDMNTLHHGGMIMYREQSGQ